MPVFFIPADDIRTGEIIITGPLLGHLRDSLRARIGEELRVGTETGQRYRTRIAAITKHELRAQILEEQMPPLRTHPLLTLGMAMLKGERMDWLVQKAVELGVSTIVPLDTQRTVVRWREGRPRWPNLRWRRIALEAAQQSERWDLPVICEPVDLSTFLRRPDEDATKLVLCERGHGQPLAGIPLPTGAAGHVICAIGPEGGWAEEERQDASAQGFTSVTLGSGILRAETAALAALAIIQSRLGELG